MSGEVHPLTNNPTLAWKELSLKLKCVQIKVPNLSEVYPDKASIYSYLNMTYKLLLLGIMHFNIESVCYLFVPPLYLNVPVRLFIQ